MKKKNKEYSEFYKDMSDKWKDLSDVFKKSCNDYKSRCEKASECIKKDTRWFDSEYARVYGELCDCAGAKNNRLEVLINPTNLLNILQNGSVE